jgi:hypothetical protein
VNEKHKTERMLFWLLENRLSHAQDLALGNHYNFIIIILHRYLIDLCRWLDFCLEPGSSGVDLHDLHRAKRTQFERLQRLNGRKFDDYCTKLQFLAETRLVWCFGKKII